MELALLHLEEGQVAVVELFLAANMVGIQCEALENLMIPKIVMYVGCVAIWPLLSPANLSNLAKYLHLWKYPSICA